MVLVYFFSRCLFAVLCLWWVRQTLCMAVYHKHHILVDRKTLQRVGERTVWRENEYGMATADSRTHPAPGTWSGGLWGGRPRPWARWWSVPWPSCCSTPSPPPGPPARWCLPRSTQDAPHVTEGKQVYSFVITKGFMKMYQVQISFCI